MTGSPLSVGLGAGVAVCVGAGVGISLGRGAGAIVGTGVAVGKGVGASVGVGTAVGMAVGVVVGQVDAVTVGVAVDHPATSVAAGAGPHAASNKMLRHTATLLLETSSFIIFRSHSVRGPFPWIVSRVRLAAK